MVRVFFASYWQRLVFPNTKTYCRILVGKTLFFKILAGFIEAKNNPLLKSCKGKEKKRRDGGCFWYFPERKVPKKAKKAYLLKSCKVLGKTSL